MRAPWFLQLIPNRTPTPISVASNPRNCGPYLAGRRRTLHPFLNSTGLPSFHPRRMGWTTLSSVEFGLFLARANCRATYHSQAVLHYSTLEDYGDNMSLAIYIHIFRNIIHNHFEPLLAQNCFKTIVLVSKFDFIGTFPTVQHNFCDLWNEIVWMAMTACNHHSISYRNAQDSS